MTNTIKKTSVKKFSNNKTKKLNEKIQKKLKDRKEFGKNIQQQKNTIDLKLDKMKDRLNKNKNKLQELKQTNKDLENTIRKMKSKKDKLEYEESFYEGKVTELQA